MHVDLAGAAEDDAVLVDQQHLTVGFHLAEDLTRRARRIEDAVEHDPARVALLIEVDRRVPAHVEGGPGRNRRGGGLPDGDGGVAAALRLRQRADILPGARDLVAGRRP